MPQIPPCATEDVVCVISSRSQAVGPALACRESFTTHGALSAAGFAPHQTGRLPGEWVARYRSDAASPGVIYAVTSYATPIAWVRQDGQVVIPDEGYSATTSRHQNLCRAWLS